MYINQSIDELSSMFESNLLDTNRGYNYYIDWTNIDGYQKYDIEIYAMDTLIGKDDNEFLNKFRELITKLPSIVEVFPYLFALSKVETAGVRKNSLLKIVGSSIDSDDFQTYSFNSKKLCSPISEDVVIQYYNFFEQMGLKYLFQNLLEKSVLDYIIGVLVGNDSNGRKNRGGTAFELACQPMLEQICNKYSLELLSQKKFNILREYGFEISEDVANRKADFILLNQEHTICMNIEVNFFNGGGSKPEEIIDSYINRQSDLEQNRIKFALITDGNCWRGTTNQLTKGFRHLNYLMNFNLAKSGMLEETILKEFFNK